MSKIDLLPNEAILKRDTNILYDKGGFFDQWGDELILTNLALIVVSKGALGGVKEVLRFPLNQVKVVNGIPQVAYGKSSSGARQLQVYFAHGVEAFSLGASDDDEDGISLKGFLTSQAEKEKSNITEWCDAVTKAVLGIPLGLSGAMCSQAARIPQGAVSEIAGALGAERSASGAAVSGVVAPSATKKCIGCMAPISGRQGEKVICRYCDTEQVI